jgi:hypothetical protein
MQVDADMTQAEFLLIEWPESFVVELCDGTRERLLRGEGVAYESAEDDPGGRGLLFATIVPTRTGQRGRYGRGLYLDEVKSISTESGRALWRRVVGSERRTPKAERK